MTSHAKNQPRPPLSHGDLGPDPDYSDPALPTTRTTSHGSRRRADEEQDQERASFRERNRQSSENEGICVNDLDTVVAPGGGSSSAECQDDLALSRDLDWTREVKRTSSNGETALDGDERKCCFSVESSAGRNFQKSLGIQEPREPDASAVLARASSCKMASIPLPPSHLTEESGMSQTDEQSSTDDEPDSLDESQSEANSVGDDHLRAGLQHKSSAEDPRSNTLQSCSMSSDPVQTLNYEYIPQVLPPGVVQNLERGFKSTLSAASLARHGSMENSLGEGFQNNDIEGQLASVMDIHYNHPKLNGHRIVHNRGSTEECLRTGDCKNYLQEELTVDTDPGIHRSNATGSDTAMDLLANEPSAEKRFIEARGPASSQDAVLQNNFRTRDYMHDADSSPVKFPAYGECFRGEFDTRKGDFPPQREDEEEACKFSTTTGGEELTSAHTSNPVVFFPDQNAASDQVYPQYAMCESNQAATYQHEFRPEDVQFHSPSLQQDPSWMGVTPGSYGNAYLYSNVAFPVTYLGTCENQAPLTCFPEATALALVDPSGQILWQPVQGDVAMNDYGQVGTFYDPLQNMQSEAMGEEPVGMTESQTTGEDSALKPFYWQSSFHDEQMGTVSGVTVFPGNGVIPVGPPDEGTTHGLLPAPLQTNLPESSSSVLPGASPRGGLTRVGDCGAQCGDTNTSFLQMPLGGSLRPPHGDWSTTHWQAPSEAQGALTTADVGVFPSGSGNFNVPPPPMSVGPHRDVLRRSRTGMAQFHVTTGHLRNGNTSRTAPQDSGGARASSKVDRRSQKKTSSCEAGRDRRPILGRPATDGGRQRYGNQTSRVRNSQTECQKRGILGPAPSELRPSQPLRSSAGAGTQVAQGILDLLSAFRNQQRVHGSTTEKTPWPADGSGSGQRSGRDVQSNKDASGSGTLFPQRPGWKRPVSARWACSGSAETGSRNGAQEQGCTQTAQLPAGAHNHRVGHEGRVDGGRTYTFPQMNAVPPLPGEQRFSQECPVHKTRGDLTAQTSPTLPHLQQNLQGLGGDDLTGRRDTAGGVGCLPPPDVRNPPPPLAPRLQTSQVNEPLRNPTTNPSFANGWVSKSESVDEVVPQSTVGSQLGTMAPRFSQTPSLPFSCPPKTSPPQSSLRTDAAAFFPRSFCMSVPPPSLPSSSQTCSPNNLQTLANACTRGTGRDATASRASLGPDSLPQSNLRHPAPCPLHGPTLTRPADPANVTEQGRGVPDAPSHQTGVQAGVRAVPADGSGLLAAADQRLGTNSSTPSLDNPGGAIEALSVLLSQVDRGRRCEFPTATGPGIHNFLLEWMRNLAAPAGGNLSTVSPASFLPPYRAPMGQAQPSASEQPPSREAFDCSSVKTHDSHVFNVPRQGFEGRVGSDPGRRPQGSSAWPLGFEPGRPPPVIRSGSLAASSQSQAASGGPGRSAEREDGVFNATVLGSSFHDHHPSASVTGSSCLQDNHSSASEIEGSYPRSNQSSTNVAGSSYPLSNKSSTYEAESSYPLIDHSSANVTGSSHLHSNHSSSVIGSGYVHGNHTSDTVTGSGYLPSNYPSSGKTGFSDLHSNQSSGSVPGSNYLTGSHPVATVTGSNYLNDSHPFAPVTGSSNLDYNHSSTSVSRSSYFPSNYSPATVTRTNCFHDNQPSSAVTGNSHYRASLPSPAWGNLEGQSSSNRSSSCNDAPFAVENEHPSQPDGAFFSQSSSNITNQTRERVGSLENFQDAHFSVSECQPGLNTRSSKKSQEASEQTALAETSPVLGPVGGNPADLGSQCGADLLDISPQVVSCLAQMFLEDPEAPLERFDVGRLCTDSVPLEPALTLPSRNGGGLAFDARSAGGVELFLPDFTDRNQGFRETPLGPSERKFAVGGAGREAVSQTDWGLSVRSNSGDLWQRFHSTESSDLWRTARGDYRRCSSDRLPEGSVEERGRGGSEYWRGGDFF